MNKYALQGDLTFALDIGTRTVVGILGTHNDGEFTLQHIISEPHNKKAMSDGQIEDINQVAKVAQSVKEQLEARSSVELKKVSVAAAGRALRTKLVRMEHDTSERDIISPDFVKSMELEAVRQAQSELDEESAGAFSFYSVGHSVVRYYLEDKPIVSLEGHKGATAAVELIATFLPGVVVDGLYKVTEKCGLTVESLTLEPIAAMNVIIPPEIRLINIALVDIGAGTSDIAISKDGSIVAYAMATIAGDEITEEIVKMFFVDTQQAERMKYQSTSGEAAVTYRDIFGIEQSVPVEEFRKKIEPAVDSLAECICKNIVEVNGGEPTAAVFLVGGGSLITGLTDKVATILRLDPNRVIVGGRKTFRHVDTGTHEVGAEHVTPLGIAMSATLNKGYDFAVIKLNGAPLRVFDIRRLSIFDLLTMQGVKQTDILGMNGRSLNFTVDGERKFYKGGTPKPASVTMNGTPATLYTMVTQGDEVGFVKAERGETPRVTIADVFGENKLGTVLFCGKPLDLTVTFTVNGSDVTTDYIIENLDRVESKGVKTLADIPGYNGGSYFVNGNAAESGVLLRDGDVVTLAPAEEERAAVTKPKTISEQQLEKDPLYEGSLWGDIKLTFNGSEITLPTNESRTPHLFLELLTGIQLDPSRGAYKLMLNGEEANFNTKIKNGDKAAVLFDDDLTNETTENNET